MRTSFERVISFSKQHNAQVFQDLKDSIDSLTPFIGAGLTADLYGSWRDAILSLSKAIVNNQIRGSIVNMLENNDYLDAAQKLEEIRGPVNLENDLIHHFDTAKLEENWDRVQQGAIWLLPDLFDCPILTTNYDETIEEVYRRRTSKRLYILDPNSQSLRTQASRLRNIQCIFKLHGTIAGKMTDYNNIILTREQYERQYCDGGAARKNLSAFIGNCSMLFLGCSLKMDKTIDVVKDAAGAGVTHFAIVSCADGEQDVRVRELAEAGIRAIVYEDGRHDSVRTLLEELITSKLESDDKCKRAASSVLISESASAIASLRIIERINSRLKRQRKTHPSFRLMSGEPSSELLPRGERRAIENLIPNANRVVMVDRSKPISFAKFMQDSWASGEQTHLLIIGGGGVGKTVAMLTFATEEGFLPKGVPAIYIPLYDLSQYVRFNGDSIEYYFEKCFSVEESKFIEDASKKPWSEGPNVILLLDGYNEVPVQVKSAVDKSIRIWAERAGTQLVTTSRTTNLASVASTRWLELQDLSRSEVKEHLKKNPRIGLPDDNSDIWRVLCTPLMLRIYEDVELFRSSIGSDYLYFEASNSAGRLVWNYLQREFHKCMSHSMDYTDGSKRAASVLLILPFICWKMELRHVFRISRDELLTYTSEACQYWITKERPARFAWVEARICSRLSMISFQDLNEFAMTTIIDETGLLTWDGEGYSLLHQSLRDGFAAIHLRNIIESPYSTIPDAFRMPVSEYVKDFLADMSAGNDILELWEANRLTQPINRISTNNILRIVYKHFGGDLTKLNWSGMDLRTISLFPYRDGTKLHISSESAKFCKTYITASVFEPEGHTEIVGSVSFSPDGALIASGSEDGSIRIWDAMTGQLLHTLRSHGEGFWSIIFGNKGMVASGSCAGKISIWNVESEGLIMEIQEEIKRFIRAVCFCSDNKIASASDDGTISIWEISSGKLCKQLDHDGGCVRTINCGPNGLLVAGYTDGNVIIWDAATGMPIHKLRVGSSSIRTVCFGSNDTLASGSDDGVLIIWDWAKREIKQVIKNNGGCIRSISFGPGGVLAGGSDDGSIRIWDLVTGELIRSIEGSKESIRSICFNSMGMIASGSYDGTVKIWDGETGHLLRNIEGHRRGIGCVCLGSDGTIVSGSYDGLVRIWNVASGRCEQEIKCNGGWVRSVCYGKNGTIVSGSDDGVVRIWDVKTNQVLHELEKHGGRITSVSYTSHKQIIANGSTSGVIRIWSAETGRLIREINNHGGWVRAVCFGSLGKLASGSDDGVVRLWDVLTGNLIRVFEGSGGRILSLSYSPNEDMIACGSDDGGIRIWDVKTAQLLHEINVGGGWVRSVCFGSNSVLASGSDDGVIRILDVETGRLVGQLDGKGSRIRSVFLNQRGMLVSGSDNGVIRIWKIGNTKDGERLNTFLKRILRPLPGIDLNGLDFSKSIIDNQDKEILKYNGVKCK